MKQTLQLHMRSLCAVLLAICLGLGPAVPAKAATTAAPTAAPETPPAAEKTYRYNITVTFGYFSFVYDWGAWNSSSFQYEAGDASTHPGHATSQGMPGWYNFDGINNKISVNSVTTQPGTEIPITIEYNNKLPDETGTPTETVRNVSLSCFEAAPAGAANPWLMETKNGTLPLVPLHSITTADGKTSFDFRMTHPLDKPNEVSVTKDVYISFSGEPMLPNGDQYMSSSIQKIGMLVLTVGKPSVLQAP